MNVLVVHRQDTDDIPSFAKKMVGEEIVIEQHETWQTPARADLEIAIPGKPGHLHGTIVLEPDGDGTVETLEGDLRVNVPLIRGKLESLVAGLMVSAMEAEERVGRRRLA
jgi:hypothetical protein